MKTSIGINGALGRMGRAVCRVALADPGVEVCALWEHADHPELGRPHPDLPGAEVSWPGDAEKGVDVVIDFSSPEGLDQLLTIAPRLGGALVSGTTGISPATRERLLTLGRTMPVLWGANMSLAVSVLKRLCAQALSMIGPDAGFDLEIVETHHNRKKDAPSGTALDLAAIGVNLWGLELVNGREGQAGPRTPSELGMHAVRGGDVVGEHSVMLLGQGERLELCHRAWDREIFARGAVFAARRLGGMPAGVYDMDTLLERMQQ